jgi:hypothetical protein
MYVEPAKKRKKTKIISIEQNGLAVTVKIARLTG